MPEEPQRRGIGMADRAREVEQKRRLIQGFEKPVGCYLLCHAFRLT